jgi:hypothetical protein
MSKVKYWYAIYNPITKWINVYPYKNWNIFNRSIISRESYLKYEYSYDLKNKDILFPFPSENEGKARQYARRQLKR